MGRFFISLSLSWLLAGAVGAQTREQKVLADKQKFTADGLWIYNDLAQGFAQAKKTGKPMLVVLRCIPCEECVKLDDDLVNQDPRVRPLLDQFVCVRLVSANGLDLALFQFDTDQSFAAFLLNADGAIYGRYGTRSHRTYWSDDVAIEGLAKALQGALALHRDYPRNQAELAGKRGPAPEVPTPEQYPQLKGKYGPKITYEAKVVQSCIHCHQIGDAQRQQARERRQPIPQDLLFSYPHPKNLGLILDPKERATVLRVEENSLAAGVFQKGDVILKLEGQLLLSIADVQWVLHRAPEEAVLKAVVDRGGRQVERAWPLPKNWRHREDISWRVSSWGLRRMGTGGMVLEALPAEDRKKAGLADSVMALLVKYVGQFGPHAAAKNAGFQAGDILLSFDGRTDLRRETDLLAYAVCHCPPGKRVPVTVLRDGHKLELLLPMQE